MEVFFLYMGVALIFVFAGICINTLHTEGKRQKRIKSIVRDSESWCSKNCITYEMCHINHKDPDDAWKELEDYCMSCPMAEALYEKWEEEVKCR
jgi:hypothetical protein